VNDMKSILYNNISPYLLKVYEPLVYELSNEFGSNSKESTEKPAQFLSNKIDNYIAQVHNLRNLWGENEKSYHNSNDEGLRNKVILKFSKDLGATDEELKNDSEALSRWFDFDAVSDRARAIIAVHERNIYFLIERFGNVEALDSNKIDYLISLAENYKGNHKIPEVALSIVLESIIKGTKISKESIARILYNVEQAEHDIHHKANYIKLLSVVNSEKFVKHYSDLAGSPQHAEDIFARENLVRVFKYISDEKLVTELITLTSNDSSSFVKQALCEYLSNFNSELAKVSLENILLNDFNQTVQASAYMAFANNVLIEKNLEPLTILTAKVFKKIKNEFVLRFCLSDIQRVFTALNDSELASKYIQKFKGLISELLEDNLPVSVKRLAIETNLIITTISNSKLHNCKKKLQDLITQINIGDSLEINDPEINSLAIDELGKLLCLIAKNEFDLEFWSRDGTYFISRGVKKEFRLWRFLHEIFISIPDKRENYNHTQGRVFHGENLALSHIAELAETQVPGEPLYINEEKSLRTFLPLLDYCLSVIDKGKEANIFSSEGITTIIPPQGFISRFYAKAMLSWQFKKVAKLRNWHQGVFWHANSYIVKLEEFGLKISFNEYNGDKSIKETKNFFKSLSIFPFVGSFGNIKEYFLSPHSNNLQALVIFLTFLIILWGRRHYLNYQKHKLNRDEIPLVVGGWGTRGKTGVERLKATLFNSLGLKVVSKTTGCEAILVIADPYQHIHEIPIIRPYDETSIWEQIKVVNFARKLKAEAFLWECMALRPAYVDIMQSEWMKDDISTLTNAHPDHEDIQGPAGIDIAHSISSFIRKDGKLLTSEEQMLPIFKEKARLSNTSVRSIDWRNVGLVPEDILNLFPYYEHPNNIALVCALAEDFRIDKNTILRSMINNVVEDIGALKAFIPCDIYNRKIQFINGMSANEEVGCVNNWKRLGFDQCDLATHSATFVSTIVNNRTDRVRRSRVFADIIANVLCADRHFLIGTNLVGLKNYIKRSWRKNLEDLINLMKTSDPLLLLDKAFIKLHVSITEDDKNKRLAAIQNSERPDDKVIVEKFTSEFSNDYAEYLKLKELIKNSSFPEQEIRNTLTDIFLKKIIIIDEDKCSPDEILEKIIEHTPPGFSHKLMGVQNIKSPGIEFIKAWQQWEISFKACNNLQSKDQNKVENALRLLSKFSEFHILSKGYVEKALTNLQSSKATDTGIIIQKITEALKNNYSNAKPNKPNFIQSFFAEILNIRRKMREKKIYEQIYEDLINKRISYVRAANELRKYMEN
jgi:poly-gamma-glutamate synthase PgsB/CapB